MLKTKALMLAKVELTYATDSAPVASANAILCEDPDITPISKSLERNNVRPNFGAKDKLIIGEGLKLSFTTELRGTGIAPVVSAPEIGPLFRGCNFTQTLVATPGQECCKYTPHSNMDGESITLWFYRDGLLFKAVGCRGTFSLDTKVNEYAKIKWEFTGIYAGPVAAGTLPTPTFSAVVPPVFKGAQFAIDNYAAVIESMKFDMKNSIAKRPDANAATGILSWNITDRAVSADIDPEVPALASKDFWDMWQASETVAMTATIGQTAGNKCVITTPAVQIDDLKFADRENVLTYGLPLRVKPTDAGNDEIEFKFN